MKWRVPGWPLLLLALTGNLASQPSPAAPVVGLENSSQVERENLLRLKGADRDSAIANYRNILRVTPDDSLAHGNLGALLISTGDLRGAVEHLTRAVQINPKQVEAWASRGKASTCLGFI
jgi:Flp pilus assembly protein TadD